MKYKEIYKNFLLVIFTVTLTLVMLVLPADILLAAQISEASVKSTDSEPATTESFGEFTHNPNEAANAYLILGSFYYSQGAYPTAEPLLIKAIKLAKAADNDGLRLSANGQLITVKFMLNKIDKDKANLLLKQNKEEYEALTEIIFECPIDCLPAKPKFQDGVMTLGGGRHCCEL